MAVNYFPCNSDLQYITDCKEFDRITRRLLQNPLNGI